MEHRFTDAVNISGTRRTNDGYLIADAFAVRTGIQLYSRREMGIDGDGMVRVYRPEEEVRSVDSMRTFSHAPVTLGHPAELVTADNWKDLAKGEVSTEAVWDNGRIRLPLIVKDAETIAQIEAGTRQLSAGYTSGIEFTDGVTPEGEHYDAVQRNIRINHLAVVPRGRAGEEFRIGDSAGAWGISPVNDEAKTEESKMTLRKIMVDGLEVETTDAGAAAIKKLETAVEDAKKRLNDAVSTHETAIADKDEEIGKLKVDLQTAKDALPKPEDLDKMVADRAELVTKVKGIVKDLKPMGMSDDALRKAAVVAKLGDAAVEGASDAEIRGMFRAISADAAKEDPVRKNMPGVKPVADAATEEGDAYQAMIADLNPEKKEA